MILVLAGNPARGKELAEWIARGLPGATVLDPSLFTGTMQPCQDTLSSWTATALAASTQAICRQRGTCIVVLPRIQHIYALLAAIGQPQAPVFLFLLEKPAHGDGLLRRAVHLYLNAGTTAQAARQVEEAITQRQGLILAVPTTSDVASLLPGVGGPQVGVDIIEIARIEQVLIRYRDRFLQRIYTEMEQTLYGTRVPELAARFAGKEAISKALGTGIWGIRWREMEILPDVRGKPLVYLHGAAAQRARELNLRHFAISLSHSQAFAIAFVVAT